MSLILKHEQHKFETDDYSGDGFISALTSLIPKVSSFVSNNKSLISSEAQALGSVAKAGVRIHDAVKKSDELKELQQLRNKRIEQQALDKKTGKDIQKSLGYLPGFPWAKYSGEKHLPGHNYTGPGTRLDLRLDQNDKPKPGEEPVNRVDAAALKHDILYRNKDLKFRHEADKQMIIELENIPNPTFKEKMQRALIIKLLKTKMK
ncbi:hypothetical protein LOTGIDRAFT_155882 [Lottia gigantea]|uniref:Phospholipase A2-like domain-containing protein n=1 Tax=Lottia gigantea TaxID=225164 RepID=V3ZPR9_LOTGI|nr:hypothetical protein LOTGIDRAFT_155882 [Lottia gigantea]ESO82846.1 hypothetical protein LOTGIDRAFT_155882 [Lottia gigantea]